MKASRAGRSPRARERGTTFVEYALFLGAVSFIVSLGVVVTGHKVGDLVAAAAAILPGGHSGDDLAFRSGELIEFTHDNGDAIYDTSRIGNADDNRLALNLGIDLSNIVKGGNGPAPPPPPPPPPPPFDGPGEIQGLLDRLQELKEPPGTGVKTAGGVFGQLKRILEDALAAAQAGNTALAIDRLEFFKDRVLFYQGSGGVTPAAAAELINRADQIINGLGGP
jgi:Flp pilus assembly pilin Flp